MTHHKLEVKPFHRDDLRGAELLEERDVVLRDQEILHQLGESTSDDVFCGAVYCGNELIFVGGWKRMTDNIVRVFVIPTKNIFKHPLAFTRLVLHWLHKLERLPGVDRVITLSRCNDRIDSWMKALGFQYETTLRRYIDTHDYRLWARNKGDKGWASEG